MTCEHLHPLLERPSDFDLSCRNWLRLPHPPQWWTCTDEVASQLSRSLMVDFVASRWVRCSCFASSHNRIPVGSCRGGGRFTVSV